MDSCQFLWHKPLHVWSLRAQLISTINTKAIWGENQIFFFNGFEINQKTFLVLMIRSSAQSQPGLCWTHWGNVISGWEFLFWILNNFNLITAWSSFVSNNLHQTSGECWIRPAHAQKGFCSISPHKPVLNSETFSYVWHEQVMIEPLLDRFTPAFEFFHIASPNVPWASAARLVAVHFPPCCPNHCISWDWIGFNVNIKDCRGVSVTRSIFMQVNIELKWRKKQLLKCAPQALSMKAYLKRPNVFCLRHDSH